MGLSATSCMNRREWSSVRPSGVVIAGRSHMRIVYGSKRTYSVSAEPSALTIRHQKLMSQCPMNPAMRMTHARRFAAVFALVSTLSIPLQAQTGCAASDSAAATAVRGRLAEWVRQADANDPAGMNEGWAPGLVGGFPRARLFSDSAAAAAAGAAATATPSMQNTYGLGIAGVVAT